MKIAISENKVLSVELLDRKALSDEAINIIFLEKMPTKNEELEKKLDTIFMQNDAKNAICKNYVWGLKLNKKIIGVMSNSIWFWYLHWDSKDAGVVKIDTNFNDTYIKKSCRGNNYALYFADLVAKATISSIGISSFDDQIGARLIGELEDATVHIEVTVEAETTNHKGYKIVKRYAEAFKNYLESECENSKHYYKKVTSQNMFSSFEEEVEEL